MFRLCRYDFSVFAYFNNDIGKVFFPQQEKDTRIALGFTVFGIAFFARPIGSILLGRIGDKYGTKAAIEISILCMGFSTFTLGCLPSFRTVGWIAPILLIIIRFLQGLSVGGQYISTVIFSVKDTSKKSQGFILALVGASGSVGFFLGNMLSILLHNVLTEDQLHNWGWRIPFWLGILVCISGFYLKYFIDEESDAHHFNDMDHLKQVFSPKGYQPTLLIALSVAAGAVSFYLLFTWAPSYMSHLLKPPVPHAYIINAAAFFGSNILFLPIAGLIVDRVKLVPIYVASTVMIGICDPLTIILIDRVRSTIVSFLAIVITGCLTSFYTPAVLIYFQDKFPQDIKVTAMSFGYNISVAIFGGFAPAIATGLLKVGRIAPATMAAIAASITLLGIYLSEKYLKIYQEDRAPVGASMHEEPSTLSESLLSSDRTKTQET